MNTSGVTGLGSLPPLSSLRPAAPSGADAAAEFRNMLVDSIEQVNEMQAAANQAVEQFAIGGDVNPAEVLTAVQKADLAFRLTMQVRNKVMQAYQEIQDIRI